MPIADFITNYFIPCLEFVIELLIISVFFYLNLNRRKGFALKLVLAISLILLSCFGCSFLLLLLDKFALGKVLIYLLLFLTVLFSSLLPFEEKWTTSLFLLGIAYALQNLIYKGFLAIWTGLEGLDVFSSIDENLYWRLFRIFSYLFFFVFAFLSYLFYLKKTAIKFKSRVLDKTMFVITFFILATSLILSSIDDVHFASLSSIRMYHFDSSSLYILRINSCAISIISSLLALFLASRSIISKELKEENEYLKHTVEQGRLQYEISKDTIELINVKVHDIKYKINSLGTENNLPSKAMEEIKDSIRIYDSRYETKNQLLNVLLTEKSLYCEQNDITFQAMVDGEGLEQVEPGDLYCLFGNLIDNALEAVRQIKEKERRFINLSSKRKGNMVLIQEENYFDGELSFKDGLPLTTKGDGNYHGFGTRSLRLIARKYGGEASIYVEKDVFHLNIILSLPNAD